jgi:hypothetical protein
MAAKEATVIMLSEINRQKPVMSASRTEGAHLVDFASCQVRGLILHKRRLYESQYAEHFRELEEQCSLMMEGVTRCGSCNRLPASDASEQFIATGSKLQKKMKELGEDTLALETAQKASNELRKAIKNVFMKHPEFGLDLKVKVSNINLRCQQLRFMLSPLLRANKASQPAHV